MPQLIPFYFINNLFYGYLAFFIILIIVANILLPHINRLYLTRNIIANL